MNVTLRQLKVFETVARHMSYTKAAEALHLSQPAVSMQIKQLEEALGLPLFEQLGKRIFLTAAGNELGRYARIIEQQLAEAELVLEELRGIKRGRLTIAVASTANYFAPRLLASFCCRYPGISFSLEVTNRERLLHCLEENERDMVIMGRPPPDRDLEAHSFMENPLVMIAAADHPLAGEASIPVERLRGERFLIREAGSGTRLAMERYLQEQGLPIGAGMEMSSNEAIKQAVQAGLGLGIVSRHTLELELETRRLAILNVVAFPILRHWYIVHRQGKRLSQVAATFKAFVVNEARSLLSTPTV